MLRVNCFLSKNVGAIESTIFELVLNGVENVDTILGVLCIFSHDIIALSIQRLVNFQLLRADLELRTLSISDQMMALILATNTNFLKGELPQICNRNSLPINDKRLKEQIISELLPGINVSYLLKYIDFVLEEKDNG